MLPAQTDNHQGGDDAEGPSLLDSSKFVDEQSYAAMAPSADHMSYFSRASTVLGILVGVLIQLSTLGANFMLLAYWGEEVLLSSKADILLFSLGWSIFTSLLAIGMLHTLRVLIEVSSLDPQYQHTEDVLEYLFLTMELRFVTGILVGVCGAWFVTDSLLGLKAQMIYTVVTLFMALVWTQMLVRFYMKRSSSHSSLRRLAAATTVARRDDYVLMEV